MADPLALEEADKASFFGFFNFYFFPLNIQIYIFLLYYLNFKLK